MKHKRIFYELTQARGDFATKCKRLFLKRPIPSGKIPLSTVKNTQEMHKNTSDSKKAFENRSSKALIYLDLKVVAPPGLEPGTRGFSEPAKKPVLQGF
jgi:hypothetical protein